jgi:hypothetical protein
LKGEGVISIDPYVYGKSWICHLDLRLVHSYVMRREGEELPEFIPGAAGNVGAVTKPDFADTPPWATYECAPTVAAQNGKDQ